MASKRKSEPVKKTAKRGKKKNDDSFDSDLSDDYGDDVGANGNGNAQPVTFDERAVLPKLPEELLASRDREPGKLLIAGMITWDIVGKRADAKGGIKIRPNLWNFHRFSDEKYRRVVSGCSSAHSVLISMDRKALTFGRNNCAQLGQPVLKSFEKPTAVPGLEGFNIIDAACGRNHTLFLTDTGLVYACGDNKSGQCGVGTSTAMITKVTRINYTGPPIIKVGCGAEFSVILDVKGNLHTFGLPEYGQLGHNTDGKYFITSSKMSFHFELSPKRVPLYIEKAKDGHVTPVDDVQIVDFACGNNHTVAVDSKKRAFSWGFGGVGRLGHAEQKDEMVPRLIKFFDSSNRGVRRIFCGSSFTLAIPDQGQLYLFGQNKKTGEANMYPKPVQDLAGWNITDLGCGYTSVVISADDSLIAWGASPTFGELGLGDLQKSSAQPKEVTKMSEMKVSQIALGYSHTMMLVNTDDEKTKLKYDKLNEFVVD
ncbi:CLUMA_CG006877, isoform A [Clunio marinus]|uniref:CLUMA_CG006877, isoform A n=1 Tax=Clunio marinus TaxID=568069 RepID=A0A1J1HZ06_9DIPT|nr:CLUMA_CG006877, isoform A [Clunio marinus]